MVVKKGSTRMFRETSRKQSPIQGPRPVKTMLPVNTPGRSPEHAEVRGGLLFLCPRCGTEMEPKRIYYDSGLFSLGTVCPQCGTRVFFKIHVKGNGTVPYEPRRTPSGATVDVVDLRKFPANSLGRYYAFSSDDLTVEIIEDKFP